MDYEMADAQVLGVGLGEFHDKPRFARIVVEGGRQPYRPLGRWLQRYRDPLGSNAKPVGGRWRRSPLGFQGLYRFGHRKNLSGPSNPCLYGG